MTTFLQAVVLGEFVPSHYNGIHTGPEIHTFLLKGEPDNILWLPYSLLILYDLPIQGLEQVTPAQPVEGSHATIIGDRLYGSTITCYLSLV